MMWQKAKVGLKSINSGLEVEGVLPWTKRYPAHGLSILMTAIALVGITPQRAIAATRTAASGSVQAEYSDRQEPNDFCLTDPALRITRNGQVAFDQPLNTGLGFCKQDQERFEVRDLDGDEEPEVILDFYSGGAHCCWFSQIFRYDPAQGTYTRMEHLWGNVGGPRLEDLDGDGTPELVSADDRFAYTFTSYAASAFPPQIWQYRDGDLVDVTRNFPDRVGAEAEHLWQRYTEASAEGYDVRGILAAYLATQYLLEQGETGWAQLEAAYQEPDRPLFFSTLREFLQDTRYAAKPDPLPASPAVGNTRILLQVEGTLETGDRILPTDNSLYDEHAFEGQQGQPVVVTLESQDFDTYLVLVDPNNDLLSENDDVNPANRNSSITVILPQTGQYLAIANAFDATGRGQYRLTVRAIVGSPEGDEQPEVESAP